MPELSSHPQSHQTTPENKETGLQLGKLVVFYLTAKGFTLRQQNNNLCVFSEFEIISFFLCVFEIISNKDAH